ncbi:Glutaredoxin [Candidatus Hydrogenisulfobacillus filiaventi]|uniref:Glutaredoxin n=1 Tax=Candidatus Hydrogenisulfobacillus filiaventi TaxID=2707344 RepID=A0A6F8ZE45_9FIRM|nr:thioredoxin family protein [Bacillota bacterium]CAB1128201.1 Glutaredoxin [Candidatus Hydrogenisulfobacillus filiaventi]
MSDLDVIVATSQWCTTCPATVNTWKNLESKYRINVRELDVGTVEGRELAVKLYIRSVPSTIVNNEIVHVGTIDRRTAEDLLAKWGVSRR